jgi:hypothetical protein
MRYLRGEGLEHHEIYEYGRRDEKASASEEEEIPGLKNHTAGVDRKSALAVLSNLKENRELCLAFIRGAGTLQSPRKTTNQHLQALKQSDFFASEKAWQRVSSHTKHT